jgi:hypothetical protein
VAGFCYLKSDINDKQRQSARSSEDYQRALAAGRGGFIQQFLTPITPPTSPDKTVGQTN